VRLVRTTIIRARQDRVWQALADWRAYSSWMPDVAWVRRIDTGPEGIGMRLAVRTKVLGIPLVTDELAVRAWDPPRLMAIDHLGLVRGPAEWRLEPSEGGSRFTWVEDLRMPPPILGEIALILYSPVLRWTFGRSVRNLRRLIEFGPAA
jgi:Polyketide cyclase / dehydrase and lipid transport